MRLIKKIIYSLAFALFIFFLTMFSQIVPCQIAPNVPNPQYTWGLCTLNPDQSSQAKTLFLGYSENLTEAYFIIIFISFILSIIVLHFVANRKD